MITASEALKTTEGMLASAASAGAAARVSKYAGEVVYIYAFDVAYEMKRQPLAKLLGQSVAEFGMDADKRSTVHELHAHDLVKPMLANEECPTHQSHDQRRVDPTGKERAQRHVRFQPQSDGRSHQFAQFGRDFASTGVWRDPFGGLD